MTSPIYIGSGPFMSVAYPKVGWRGGANDPRPLRMRMVGSTAPAPSLLPLLTGSCSASGLTHNHNPNPTIEK